MDLGRPNSQYKTVPFVPTHSFYQKKNNKRKKDTIKAHEQVMNNHLCSDLILSLFNQFINRYFHSVSFDLGKSNSSNV